MPLEELDEITKLLFLNIMMDAYNYYYHYV